jgi:ketosteroid isomerase-like protein
VDEERCELVRQAMRDFELGEEWLEVLDPDSPSWLVDYQRELIAAYRAGDLGWLLETTDPEVEIVQPPEFPDARTYRGHEGMLEALLDWPSEWEDFRIEPKRVFRVDDDRYVVEAIHRGRSLRMGIDIEAEIVWLFTRRDGRLVRWDMFMSLEQALGAAGSGAAGGGSRP